MSKEVLVQIKNLKKYFTGHKGQTVKAVDGITLDIYKGETFGLVGESGCGKSTTGRTITRLHQPTEGEVIFKGVSVHQPKARYEEKFLRQKMQMIFQDPYASLNPRMKAADIIAEGIDIHRLARNKRERMQKVHELLTLVGLDERHADRYPYEFSGGQRQRIGIARALAVDPEFIVCDEPIAALDVSIQAQIVNLLKSLQRKKGLTYLFIAHDLHVVRHISDRIGVMLNGKLVEVAESEDLYNNPLHAYTKALLSAIPVADPRVERSRTRITFKPSGNDNRRLQQVKKNHWVRL